MSWDDAFLLGCGISLALLPLLIIAVGLVAAIVSWLMPWSLIFVGMVLLTTIGVKVWSDKVG